MKTFFTPIAAIFYDEAMFQKKDLVLKGSSFWNKNGF